MSITLTDGTTTLSLHPDLFWVDEFEWQPVEQTEQRTITGALIVESALRIGGRPITLQPEDDASAWISREALTAIGAWAAIPGKTMTLTLRGVARDVIFRHQEKGLTAKPLIHYSDPDTNDYYLATVRFMEI